MVKESNNMDIVIGLINTYIEIDDPDYELHITPNGIVYVRIKWKLVTLEQGFNLFEKMGVKSPHTKLSKQTIRDINEFKAIADMENAIENARIRGEKND